jgi:hypothetical protein
MRRCCCDVDQLCMIWRHWALVRGSRDLSAIRRARVAVYKITHRWHAELRKIFHLSAVSFAGKRGILYWEYCFLCCPSREFPTLFQDTREAWLLKETIGMKLVAWDSLSLAGVTYDVLNSEHCHRAFFRNDKRVCWCSVVSLWLLANISVQSDSLRIPFSIRQTEYHYYYVAASREQPRTYNAILAVYTPPRCLLSMMGCFVRSYTANILWLVWGGAKTSQSNDCIDLPVAAIVFAVMLLLTKPMAPVSLMQWAQRRVHSYAILLLSMLGNDEQYAITTLAWSDTRSDRWLVRLLAF